MTTPRYLLARYIPDVWRMEPRNIGVIVWSPERTAARFLGEKQGAPGDIDGRSIPSFVKTPSAYRQWVRQWQKAVMSGCIPWSPDRGGIERESPDFLDMLAASSQGNFLLEEGGKLLDEVAPNRIEGLVNYLFSTLVTEGVESSDTHDPSLGDVCDRVISELGLRNHPHFRTDYPVGYQLRNKLTAELEFSYAFVNGKVQRLYQRVPLPSQKVTLRRAIHDSAWMFEKVRETGVVEHDNGVALIRASDEQLKEPYAKNMVAVLASVAHVVNVYNPIILRDEFRQLAAHGV